MGKRGIETGHLSQSGVVHDVGHAHATESPPAKTFFLGSSSRTSRQLPFERFTSGEQ